jgi:hypothetical protein
MILDGINGQFDIMPDGADKPPVKRRGGSSEVEWRVTRAVRRGNIEGLYVS